MIVDMSQYFSKFKKFLYQKFIGDRIIKFGNPIDIVDGNRVWFVSDLHFGHRNIIKWCRPEFRNLHEMHSRMISNWNFHVGNFDRVFCLGDFGDTRNLKRLKGKITIAKGNHDKKQWNKQFVIQYRNLKFLVLHDPDSVMTNWFDGDWIIHGHTHVNSPFVDIRKKELM